MHAGIAIIVVAAVVVLLAAWLRIQRRRSLRLRDRFGPEYERTVRQQGGSSRRAEEELEKRVQRVENFDLRPLSDSERQHYVERWMEVQRRFVDYPRSAVFSADDLVTEVMCTEGYPMADFEQRAADISVEHPLLVSNYRVAHAIALRERGGATDTEELRKAIVHFRFLFEQLIESGSESKEVA